MRLGKDGGAIAGSRKASTPQCKAPKFKRRAWGGREEGGKLTQAKKKGTNPPVSYDGLQPNTPRVPSFETRFHGIKLGFLDGKREERVTASLL
jgi:hypothetical protein